MMKSTILACTIVVLLATNVLAREVKFKNCGNHEFTKLDIIGCAGNEPSHCAMQKGKEFSVDVTMKSNQDTKNVQFKFTANVGGIEIPVPGTDVNGCHGLQCPLVKDQTYHFTYKMEVPKELPTLNKVLVEIALIGDHGQLGCLHLDGGVVD